MNISNLLSFALSSDSLKNSQRLSSKQSTRLTLSSLKIRAQEEVFPFHREVEPNRRGRVWGLIIALEIDREVGLLSEKGLLLFRDNKTTNL